MGSIGFKPKNVTKKLVSSLPDRTRDVIVKRYGLEGAGETMTLEAIGSQYGITRERVRQIENSGLTKIRSSSTIAEESSIFEELRNVIASLGYVVPEEDLLSHLSNKQDEKNHYYFLLMVGDPFTRQKSNSKYHHRWHVSKVIADAIHSALDAVKKKLSPDDLVPEDKLLTIFVDHLDSEVIPKEYLSDKETLKRWLRLSKEIDSNPLGEWGPASSPIVRLKGMRDYAYLVLRKHGSPMHFREVTDRIADMFGRDAHTATTHNELIRDDRFVLVGRGLYALKEWGYKQGVVRDVIADIIREHGPMTKEEVVDRVLKERYVKSNTVMVNLQDSSKFQRLPDGRYDIVS